MSVNYFEKFKEQYTEDKTCKTITDVIDYVDYLFSLENSDYEFNLEYGEKPIRFIEKIAWKNNTNKLTLWQKTIIQIFYGFVTKNEYEIKKNDFRKVRFFRELFIKIPRGHGKTGLIAALDSYNILFEGGTSNEFYNFAYIEKQAQMLSKEVAKIFRMEEFEELGYRVVNGGSIRNYNVPELHVEISSIKASSSLDGQNIACAILDEVHTYKDIQVYNTIKGSIKMPNAMIIEITTGGFVEYGVLDALDEKANFLLREENYPKEIRFNETEKTTVDRMLPFRWQLDNMEKWNQIEEIKKVNPSWDEDYFKTVKEQILQSKANIERGLRSEDKSSFFTKRLNIQMNSDDAWFDNQMFLNSPQLDERKYFHNNKFIAFGGVDLAITGDNSVATIILYDWEIDKYIVWCKGWISEQALKVKTTNNEAPYHRWVDEDKVRIAGYESTDNDKVVDWFVEMREKGLYIAQIGYDPAHFQKLKNLFEDQSFDIKRIGQTAVKLSECMKDIKDEFQNNKIDFRENDFLKWNLLNVVPEFVGSERLVYPKKVNRSSNKRIDAFSALLDSWKVRFMYNDEVGSIN